MYIILMDLEMPGIDRWEPLRTLKNDPHTRDIPIIGVSAYALARERETAIVTGCDEFDVKPIEFESLVATIRRVVVSRHFERGPIEYALETDRLAGAAGCELANVGFKTRDMYSHTRNEFCSRRGHHLLRVRCTPSSSARGGAERPALDARLGTGDPRQRKEAGS